MKFSMSWVKGMLLAVAVMSAVQGSATPIFVQDGTLFGTTIPPAGPGPWVTARFDDVSAGTVSLTISNIGLTGMEFVSFAYFNLDPALDPAGLQFTNMGGGGVFDLPSVDINENRVKANGNGSFDFGFDFSSANTGARFDNGDYIVYYITGLSGLTADDFAFLCSRGGGQGTYYSAVHIQGMDGDVSASAYAGAIEISEIPEPAPLALLAVGAMAWFRSRLRI